jgi:hypothetical protein
MRVSTITTLDLVNIIDKYSLRNLRGGTVDVNDELLDYRTNTDVNDELLDYRTNTDVNDELLDYRTLTVQEEEMY